MSITYEEYRELVCHSKQNENCPVTRLLNLFSGKWHTRVIFELTKVETARFGQLKKSIGSITNTMLSNTLNDLEKNGIISRRQFNEIPLHVEYSLTESGKDLYRIFYEMALWGSRHSSRNE
ncbi:MAG: winged helix-turn-helix transcriptional regulator [Candidatus Coproplasma sp.]